MKGLLQKLFKPSPKQAVVVVSGLPRSGTSMMMKMLEAGGIPPLTDQLRTADTDNPKGYYEFERVKQLDKGDTAWVGEAQGKAVKVISALLKYLPADYEYKVIFMRRNMSEILASQRKMLVHRGEDPDKMDETQLRELFEAHLNAVLGWLESQPHVSVLHVQYNEMLADPISQLEQINNFLGENLNIEAMTNIIDPNLYRNRKRQSQSS